MEQKPGILFYTGKPDSSSNATMPPVALRTVPVGFWRINAGQVTIALSLLVLAAVIYFR